MSVLFAFLITVSAIFAFGIRIIRPTHRGAVEFLGKYKRYCLAGFNWIIPIIETMHYVDITENMVDVPPQDIITEDNLNAKVDLVVYYKVKDDEKNVAASLYNVNFFRNQIVSLAQTTARNVIGGMKFTDVNSQRNTLNGRLSEILDKESDSWGVAIVRVELKEITPPKDVQETMNTVIKSQNQKQAAIDFATAKETEADGVRRAAIKEAEGHKQASILKAQGQAEAIKLVNEAAEKYFKGNAIELKKLESVVSSLQQGTKYVLSSDLFEIIKGFTK